MLNPKIKTSVVHSRTKSAWNIIGTSAGGKYKIARLPYYCGEDEEVNERHRKEAYDHAVFISYCFNQSDVICKK
jgi:hypothetical protein